MSFGATHEALDNLTYFEEQLLSPIQPVVRIFTLYGTGLTETRGHVANWVQNGPEYVRGIPLKAKDAKVLLVRRFPKDPNRVQRVPFVVSRRRLEAALDQLVKPEDQGGHGAFPPNTHRSLASTTRNHAREGATASACMRTAMHAGTAAAIAKLGRDSSTSCLPIAN